jgi:hypothetical protein
MKKSIVLLGLLASLTVLSSCGSGKSSSTGTYTPTTHATVTPSYPHSKAGVIEYLKDVGTYSSSSNAYVYGGPSHYSSSDGVSLTESYAFMYYQSKDRFAFAGNYDTSNSNATGTFFAVADFAWGSYASGIFGGKMGWSNGSAAYSCLVSVTVNTFYTDGEIHNYNWQVSNSSFPSGSDYSNGVSLLLDAFNYAADRVSTLLSAHGLPAFY